MDAVSAVVSEVLEEALTEDRPFITCNGSYCSTRFKYTDWVVHSKIDGPDPRDHFANERNFLSWLRMGMTLALIGFMTLLDIQTKEFEPSKSLPWANEPVATKIQIVAYTMIGLGFSSVGITLIVYFKNQQQLLNQFLEVGHGWLGYTTAFLITLFVCFVMVAAMAEGS
ncbi:hypothetical protein BX666DRAFT_2027063 [Dichotomocladium elegans]|nr:hypothetical protein BX666DRAFT_2027063 [Dichotomocladium elegans]